ncbi:MAG: YdeI/OmpD-associated family protein [Flavobacteriales bacterium]|nr:YdeI/OmpD-associated family protein [Flavobacteriales bacterium]
MTSSADAYFSALETWGDELNELRLYLLDCNLEEGIKWKQACYTSNGKNIAIIGAFKNYCVLSFFKGSLLKDEQGILEFAGENSRSAKIIKFRSLPEVKRHQSIIASFIHEAIIIEDMGLKVAPLESEALQFPEELLKRFEDHPSLKQSFLALTPGRQRAYCMHFGSAKNESTRFSRIEKASPRILQGKGMNDCICGLSKRMPACDGSHKALLRK